jgi:hypothetical protein
MFVDVYFMTPFFSLEYVHDTAKINTNMHSIVTFKQFRIQFVTVKLAV